MDNAKNPSENNDNVSRDNLIVPEEIFAEIADNEQEPEEIIEDFSEESSEPNVSDDIEAATADVQISFFEEDAEQPTEKSEDKIEEKNKVLLFEEMDETVYDPKKPRFVDRLFDFVELFALTIATVFFLTTLLFRHTIVDGPSMDKTLAHNQHLIISNVFYEPKRGDIIVFEDYNIKGPNGNKLDKPIVKRIIALEGETVWIDETGIVYVNNNPLDENEYKYVEGNTYVNFKKYIYAKEKPYIVPAGHIFVLGDNRNHSDDSRVFGAIPEDTILGEVKFRIFPFGDFGFID